jgi:hypothetical protein
MASKVPPEIRERVLTLWLMAYSRDSIAQNVGIGAGTVSEMVKAYIQRDPEFVLLREFVIAVKKEAGGIRQLATAVRLQRFLESHSLDGEQIESLISVAYSQCFKKGISVRDFVENANKVSDLADRTDVDVEKLSDYILERTRELFLVTNNLSRVKAERDATLRECDEKKIQLEDLNKSMAKTQTIKCMQFNDALRWDNQIRFLEYAISQWSWERFCRNRLAEELGEANKKLYGNIDQVKNHQSTATKSAQAKSTTN